MPLHADSSRFSGWPWILLPTLILGLISGLLLSLATVHEHAAMRDALTQQSAVALAQAVAPGFPERPAAEMRRLAQPLMEANPAIAAIAVRDAQGQSLLELHNETVPEEGFWSPFIWATAPIPAAMEAPVPGATRALQTQPPAVRVWMFPAATDPALRASLSRLWILLGLALLLSAPTLGFVRRQLVARHRPLLAVARSLAQGRTELRAPSQPGLSGALAEALNQIGEHLKKLQHSTSSADDPGLLRQDLARERARLRAVEQDLDAARELAQQRGRLIGSLAHELRTPLAALTGHVELLTVDPAVNPSRETLNLLRSSVRQMMRLVNDLLDWSRIENGQIALTRESFDLTSEIEDTLRLLAPLAYEKGLELSHLVYHDVPAALTGDAARLRQILTNLLSNAIKYTSKGEIVLRVMKERSEQDRVLLTLRVSDTGVGIASDQLARLFLPYQRITETGAKGTGLGLAITRHLVERMGGTLRVESQPGRGSDFYASVWMEASPGARQPAFTGLEGLRIWIADESASARLALRHRLEWWGAPTREFETLNELLTALRATDAAPDLLIVGMKSIAVQDPALQDLARLQTQAGARPLLLRVNSTASQHRDHVLDLGVTECLPKCADSRELANTLMRLAGRAPPVTPVPVLTGKRVLLADDNQPSRVYLKALLENLGAEVLEARNGLEATELCLAQPPDLALLDVHMPLRNGTDCAREIRAKAKKRIPLIATSAHLEPEERDALKLAGMDGVLLKPFDATQLQSLAATLLTERAPDTRPAKVLVEDHELRALLSQELPNQLRNLEQALTAADWPLAREAAHQLHGSCAFYQLPDLRRVAAAVEARLARGEPVSAEELSALRDAGERTLHALAA